MLRIKSPLGSPGAGSSRIRRSRRRARPTSSPLHHPPQPPEQQRHPPSPSASVSAAPTHPPPHPPPTPQRRRGPGATGVHTATPQLPSPIARAARQTEREQAGSRCESVVSGDGEPRSGGRLLKTTRSDVACGSNAGSMPRAAAAARCRRGRGPARLRRARAAVHGFTITTRAGCTVAGSRGARKAGRWKHDSVA